MLCKRRARLIQKEGGEGPPTQAQLLAVQPAVQRLIMQRTYEASAHPPAPQVFLFDEGSTISWIPCGRKLTCSFPGIKFYYGPDTWCAAAAAENAAAPRPEQAWRRHRLVSLPLASTTSPTHSIPTNALPATSHTKGTARTCLCWRWTASLTSWRSSSMWRATCPTPAPSSMVRGRGVCMGTGPRSCTGRMRRMHRRVGSHLSDISAKFCGERMGAVASVHAGACLSAWSAAGPAPGPGVRSRARGIQGQITCCAALRRQGHALHEARPRHAFTPPHPPPPTHPAPPLHPARRDHPADAEEQQLPWLQQRHRPAAEHHRPQGVGVFVSGG